MKISRYSKLDKKWVSIIKSEKGAGIIEILIVLLIMAIVTVIAVMGITKVRYELMLTNAGDTMRAYLEKAGADARRRHAQTNSRSVVEVLSPSSYRVQIDFDGDGKIESRTINLTKDVSFSYEPGSMPKATFDWRGKIAEGDVTFTMTTYQSQLLDIQVSSFGDATDEELPTLPTVSVTPDSSDVASNAVLKGDAASNVEVDPTPTPSPLPVCTGSQKPIDTNCRCQTGKVVKSDGKCS